MVTEIVVKLIVLGLMRWIQNQTKPQRTNSVLTVILYPLGEDKIYNVETWMCEYSKKYDLEFEILHNNPIDIQLRM